MHLLALLALSLALMPTAGAQGLLLERFDEHDIVRGTGRERTIVKMVIEGGAADVRGVKLGSKLVSLNDTVVLSKTYLEVS